MTKLTIIANIKAKSDKIELGDVPTLTLAGTV